jgi:hypothetical protein
LAKGVDIVSTTAEDCLDLSITEDTITGDLFGRRFQTIDRAYLNDATLDAPIEKFPDVGEDTICLVMSAAFDGRIHDFQYVSSLDLADVALTENCDKLTIEDALVFRPSAIARLGMLADEVVHNRVNSISGLTPTLSGIGALIELAKVVHRAFPRLCERHAGIDADG